MLSKEALEFIKQLATETPITVTGANVDQASKILHEVLAWVDGELLPKKSE